MAKNNDGVRMPAWMGRSEKGAREGSSPVLGTQGGFGTVKSGVGVKTNDPSIPGWQEPMQNTGRTDRRVLDDNAQTGRAVVSQNNMLPGGQGAPMIAPAPKLNLPAWMQPRPPAYGGQYNPTVNNPAHPSNQPAAPAQVDTYESYQGQPVNDSMSDLLRSMQPVALDSGEVSMSDYLRSLQVESPYVLPPAWMQPTSTPSTFSMGSKYGGNWRRGGGGGWGDGSGYEAPAWMNNEMGLFSWKY